MADDGALHIDQVMTMPLQGMWVQFCVICDRVLTEADATVSFIRVIDRFMVDAPGFPVAVGFWIAVGLRDVPATNPPAIGVVIHRRRDGFVVAQGELDVDAGSPSVNAVLQIPAFPIAEEGDYQVSVVSEGREISRVAFEVVLRAHAPSPSAAETGPSGDAS